MMKFDKVMPPPASLALALRNAGYGRLISVVGGLRGGERKEDVRREAVPTFYAPRGERERRFTPLYRAGDEHLPSWCVRRVPLPAKQILALLVS